MAFPTISSLVSYWKCDEASGNLIDVHGSNDVTDTNTVGATTGILNGCRSHVKANSEYFKINDGSEPTAFEGLNVDFSVSFWVNGANTSGTMGLIGKMKSGVGGWVVYGLSGVSNIRFLIRNETTAEQSLVTWSGLTSDGTTWYHVVATHDAASNVIAIIVNDGTPITTGHTDGCTAHNQFFSIGSHNGAGNNYDGLIDEILFCQEVLSAAQITALYGSGTPPAYSVGGGPVVPALDEGMLVGGMMPLRGGL